MIESYLKPCNALLGQRKFSEAKAGFEYVLLMEPNSCEAFRGLAFCQMELKQWQGAIVSALNTLSHGGNKKSDLILLLNIIEKSGLQSYVANVINPLLLLMKDPLLEERAIRQLWQQIWGKYKLVFSSTSHTFNKELTLLLQDPIFCKLLERSLIVDYRLEALLLFCRKELLLQASSGQSVSKYQNFLSSLACLTFFNDDLYYTTEEEQLLLEKLNNTVEHLLVLFCYVELRDALVIFTNNHALFSSTDLNYLTDEFQFYLKLFSNDAKGKITNEASKQVQSFYMENPYPKWKTLNVNSFNLSDIYGFANLKFKDDGNILIAGCGTGHQIMNYALNYPKANIIAIDLSPTSLAYAQSMVEKHSITNVSFQLLDILNVGELDTAFNLIVCTGVLHHMAVPQDGLAALESVLHSEGMMQLAFYSRCARKELASIKDNIRAVSHLNNDITDEITKNDVRRWRSQLTTENKKNPWYYVEDFFYLNGLYDLLFHPQQSEYDLLTIDSMLTQCELKFEFMMKARINNKDKKELMKEQYSYLTTDKSLQGWHDFELEHPDTFKNMYQFFVSHKR